MTQFKFLHKREDTLPYVQIAQEEADKEKKALGFLSPQAYQSAAYSEKIIIAVTNDANEYAGHIFYGGVFPNARIFQTLVSEKFRKNGLASTLVEKLASHLEEFSFFSITAKVATDLVSANKFYEKHGFKIIRTVAGGKTTKRMLHIRGKELNTPSLFEWKPTPKVSDHFSLSLKSSTRSPQYLIDLNVIFDAVHNRANSEAAGILMKASFQNLIRIAVSEELVDELKRTSNDRKNDPILKLAENFWRLAKPSTKKIKEYSSVLAPIVFPDRHRDNILTTQDQSDLAHLATAIENGVAGFITSEKNILASSNYFMAEHQIEIIDLFELQELVKDEPEQEPVRVEQRATTELHTHLSSSFDSSLGVKAAIKALNISQSSLPNPDISRKKELRSIVISTKSGKYAALAWWTTFNGPAPINTAYLCIDEQSLQVENLIDCICERISRESSGRDISLVKLVTNSKTPQAILALENNGFKPTGATELAGSIYQKICIGNAIHPKNWHKVRLKISNLTDGLTIPKEMPSISSEQRLIQITGSNGNPFSIDYKEFEKLLSPTLITSPNISGVIVPIVKSYASDLFGIEADQLSLLETPDAVLKRERVYFCSPAAKKALSPDQIIFFYESKSEKGGKGAIIAAGRITESNVALVDDMEENLLERGVIDRRMLTKTSLSGKKAVVFFNNILLFKKPVSFNQLDKLGCNDGSKFVTAKQISARQSQQILIEGFSNV